LTESIEQTASAAAQSIDQKIVALFRRMPGGIISGEELGKTLSISRTAVWKHIKALKELGYQIEAVPSRGYRLIFSPDLLIPAEISAKLATKRIGRKIIYLKETDSTNLVAFKYAEEGAEEGTVVIAEQQHRGKGRMGRHWESPYGINLYTSIILRPPLPPVNAPQLTFLSAVAVAQAIETTTSLRPAIKWPNDVLVNGMKVAGLLNEINAETEKIHFIVLGIGVNINMPGEQFPDTLRHPASSLLLEGGSPVNRVEFTRALFIAFDRLYDAYLTGGYNQIREEWLLRSIVSGKRVKISFEKSETVGIATGIDDYGALLVRHDNGEISRVLAGDVSLLD
jgi:BirA family biotin operon repressor/biotin-[acetyl-CoA-carboxylase] ligase